MEKKHKKGYIIKIKYHTARRRQLTKELHSLLDFLYAHMAGNSLTSLVNQVQHTFFLFTLIYSRATQFFSSKTVGELCYCDADSWLENKRDLNSEVI
jgi:hypothetical protein